MNAISIKGLVKEYGAVKAVRGIDLEIQEGEFFGLLGPNGAGKSTTIGILTGLVNKSEGEVSLFGKDVAQDYVEARRLIGLVPQEFNFDIFEKVWKILDFNAGFFGMAKGPRRKRSEELLRMLGLWEKRNAMARELSGGMKRKLMIARALMHSPRILILDEPTAGVDVEARRSMWSFLERLNKKGVTILYTTHYLEEAERLCTRIGIINDGKIIALDEKDALLAKHDKKLEDLFVELTSGADVS